MIHDQEKLPTWMAAYCSGSQFKSICKFAFLSILGLATWMGSTNCSVVHPPFLEGGWEEELRQCGSSELPWVQERKIVCLVTLFTLLGLRYSIASRLALFVIPDIGKCLIADQTGGLEEAPAPSCSWYLWGNTGHEASQTDILVFIVHKYNSNQ